MGDAARIGDARVACSTRAVGPVAAAVHAVEPEPEDQSEHPRSITKKADSGESDMSNQWFNPAAARRSCLTSRSAIVLLGALLANDASWAAGDSLGVVRDLATRVGPIIGSALACQNVARPRVQVIIDKFQAVIREASSARS